MSGHKYDRDDFAAHITHKRSDMHVTFPAHVSDMRVAWERTRMNRLER